MSTHEDIPYKDGKLDVPHLGITLRTLFAAAAEYHDIHTDGRKVKIYLRGVYIGTIQLSDAGKKKEET